MAFGNPATYRSHHVCVRCRSSYKRNGPPAPCPGCGERLVDAGVCLAVPARRDRRGWRALAAALDAGLRFHPACGCCYSGPGYRPRTVPEVRERLTVAARNGLPPAQLLALADPAGAAGAVGSARAGGRSVSRSVPRTAGRVRRGPAR
ncbi:hypothetical protein ACF1DY_22760 [Streptomyces albus]